MEIQAAVLREHHGDFAIETVELDALRDDEALIEIAATGLCHYSSHLYGKSFN